MWVFLRRIWIERDVIRNRLGIRLGYTGLDGVKVTIHFLLQPRRHFRLGGGQILGLADVALQVVQIQRGGALIKSKELVVALNHCRVHRAVSVVRIMKIETPLGKLGICISFE